MLENEQQIQIKIYTKSGQNIYLSVFEIHKPQTKLQNNTVLRKTMGNRF